MTNKRKAYSKEQKLKAVKLVVEENQSVTDVARTPANPAEHTPQVVLKLTSHTSNM